MRFWLKSVIVVALLAVAATLGADESAYREEIMTPHWDWAPALADGPVSAVVVVNDLAAREPEELAQRVEFRVQTLPLTAGEKAAPDSEAFVAALGTSPDLIVLATNAATRGMTPAALDALWKALVGGATVVMYRQQVLTGPLGDLLKLKLPTPGAADAVEGVPVSRLSVPPSLLALFPVDALPFRGKPVVDAFAVGQGRLIALTGWDTHWTWFNAFVPAGNNAMFDQPLARELSYGFMSHLLLWAARGDAAGGVQSLSLPATPPEIGNEAALDFALAAPAQAGDTLAWTLHTPWGDPAATGQAPLAAGATSLRCVVKPPQAGKDLFRWQLLRGGKALDFGASFLTVTSPLTLQAVVPETVPMSGRLGVTWQTEGLAAGDQVLVRVWDPDDRVVTGARVAATAGRANLPAWLPRSVTHQVSLRLLRGGLVLDEQRFLTNVAWDRALDRREYQVLAWATEIGGGVEYNRYRLLRRLGLTALAVIGRRDAGCRLASEAGLRLVPTNILVPAGAYKPTFDEKKEEEGLAAFIASIGKYCPLGYSLADEPNTQDPGKFRDWGAEIIHRSDPGAPVGFCGVWEGFDRNVPDFFAHCDFAEPYSPFHLYTPNLWLGCERDLYRSFRRPDSVITCWTHYAPWADSEPYSRSVPWLWLFEGLNGVSYFDTAGSFAILPADGRMTHETRWWTEEVRELTGGIGAQILGMQRETGAVRVLFTPKATGSEDWARALNESHVPYRFLSHAELAAGLGPEVRLLICPEAEDVTATEYAALEGFVRRGGVVVATGALGLFAGGEATLPDRLTALFGVIRSRLPADAAVWAKDKPLYAKIPAAPTPGPGGELVGRTLGETGIQAAPGVQATRYARVGEMTPDSPGQPAFVKALFAQPAQIRKTFGKGTTYYLTFHPDVASLKLWLPTLLAEAGAAPLDVRITVPDGADTVYLYPFRSGKIRLVGVIQDYWRLPPAEVLEDKETVAYFNHGPQRWTERDADLTLGAPAYLYDVRRGALLGQVASARLKLLPGRPELFALLPYQVTGLTLTLPAQAQAGDTLEIGLALAAKGGPPGDHVINVSLIDPTGRQTPADRYNVHTRAGQGSVKVQFPLNAAPGAWRVVARDALTGTRAEKTVTVAAGATDWQFAPPQIQVQRVPLSLPVGEWKPYVAPQPDPTRAALKVGAINRARSYAAADHRGHEFVSTSATLSNAEISWRLNYNVCNDTKAHQWTDPRQIWAAYPPGLGFNQPNPNSWYYNGYLDVLLDDFRAANYALSEFAAVPDGNNARLRAVFDTPKGKITLFFVLTPDHPAIFQEMVVEAAEPISKITLRFRSYYAGFGGPPNQPFVTVEPERKAWALMGDEINEPAYGRGSGSCAMLVLPEELDSIAYGNQPTLVKTVNLHAGQSARFHWALWIFPKTSNAAALKYMQDSAAASRTRLLKLYGVGQ